ncbi:hypothetical protein DRO91_03565 [Candidatus Heimdallarchaeota archaeon]|nr:MAG: hypothetical protein DRO91_03565 [Candidatus Heimdallarchaeota archaeon]
MTHPLLIPPFTQKLSSIMRNHELAKFGDSLVTFAYSLMKTKVTGTPTGVRVLDKALAEAIRQVGLRSVLHSSIGAGEIGDGAEALIGYCFLEGLLSLDEIITIMKKAALENKHPEEKNTRAQEKEQMTQAFTALLQASLERVAKKS